jgi:hypothetical protein
LDVVAIWSSKIFAAILSQPARAVDSNTTIGTSFAVAHENSSAS